eukprot:m.503816 g.503816  ORF g.503816 m.503816 type:complete len:254 (+) comp72769_c0_seq1:482-1243(+)
MVPGKDNRRNRVATWQLPAGTVVMAVVLVNGSEDDIEKRLEAEGAALTAALKACNDGVMSAVLAYTVSNTDGVFRAMRQVGLDFALEHCGSEFCFVIDDNVAAAWAVPHKYNANKEKDTLPLSGQHRGSCDLSPVLLLLADTAKTWDRDSMGQPLGALGVKGHDKFQAGTEFMQVPPLRRGHVKWLGLFSTEAASKFPYRYRGSTGDVPGLFKTEDFMATCGPSEDLCHSWDLHRNNYFVGWYRLFWIQKAQK